MALLSTLVRARFFTAILWAACGAERRNARCFQRQYLSCPAWNNSAFSNSAGLYSNGARGRV